MSDFTIEMPEAEITEAELSARYTQNGGFCYDPVKKAYRFAYQSREWFQTLDNENHGDCAITTEEFAVWNVTLWYEKMANGKYRCLEGYRESVGFYWLHHEICKEGRELATKRTWIEWLLNQDQVKQRFRYHHEDGSDPDEIWRTVTQ
jgi:hypothetical protein